MDIPARTGPPAGRYSRGRERRCKTRRFQGMASPKFCQRGEPVTRSRALVLAAAVSVGYVAFLGWPAPATRAAALAVLLALSRIRQRRVETNTLLSATCLCVL